MVKLRVRRIGNSLGLILPREAVARLRVVKGDQLALTESPDGLRLTPYDPDFARQMKVADGVLGRYRNAFRKLAR